MLSRDSRALGTAERYLSTDKDDLLAANSFENLGTVHVLLGEDLDHDRVTIDSGRTSDLLVLGMAIANLPAIRDTLTDLMPQTAGVGACDWGRCGLPEGHDGDHLGPSEAEGQAHENVMRAARKGHSAV